MAETMDLDYYLAVPYVLAMESVEHSDGDWYRRAEYPELPNCAAEAYSAVEAIEKLEEERIRCISRSFWSVASGTCATAAATQPWASRSIRIGWASHAG